MLHKNKILLLFSMALFCSGLSFDLYAQQCGVIPEMVTRLFYPDSTSYTVWHADYGEGQKEEVFKASLRHGEGILAIGEMVRIEGVKPSMMIVKFDRRGREVWTKYHAITGLSDIVSVLPHGAENEVGERGFVVLANIDKANKRKNFWIGFFDKSGKLLSSEIVQDDMSDLIANDFQFSIDGGFVVSSSVQDDRVVGNESVLRQKAALYLLDENANVISKRSYVLGDNNHISSLSVLNIAGEDVGYIATGWFENGYGKRQGWLLRLDGDLALTWQKEFRRGKMAKLEKSTTDKNGQIIALGRVDSGRDEGKASWIVAVDSADGGVVWQRYYYSETEQHDYAPLGIVVNNDGVLSVVMNAFYKGEKPVSVDVSDDVKSADKRDVDYVHVLYLNPRGVTISGDVYLYERGLNGFHFLPSSDGRFVLSGRSLVVAEDIFKMSKSSESSDIPPLVEPRLVNLPEVEMSDKAKEGLQKLKKNIYKQDSDHDEHHYNGESLNDSANLISLTYNGWVSVLEAPSAYSDPCGHVRTR